ncbi:GyrI-like domain-containing protein [Clostridium sp. CTA-7]
MDKLDYKKEFKELYLPKERPVEIFVPNMKFIMIDGCGNPNDEDGEYKKAVEILYALSYTIKMNKEIKNKNEYFEYVMPPLEGLWWLKEDGDMNFTEKEKFFWTSMIRQPDFVTKEIFEFACNEVKKKRPYIDTSIASLEEFKEGLCVQSMHIGAFESEDITIKKIDEYIKENNLIIDINGINEDGKIRRHHEIYLSDPRKIDKERMRTVLRHPVRRNL